MQQLQQIAFFAINEQHVDNKTPMYWQTVKRTPITLNAVLLHCAFLYIHRPYNDMTTYSAW